MLWQCNSIKPKRNQWTGGQFAWLQEPGKDNEEVGDHTWLEAPPCPHSMCVNPSCNSPPPIRCDKGNVSVAQ